MSTVAQDLRQLAAEIEAVTRVSRASSIAHEQVQALVDYLCLRARLSELEVQGQSVAKAPAPVA